MSVEYNLKLEDNEKLVEQFQRLAEKSETLTNEYFDKVAAKLMMEKIIGFMPRSEARKKHAKDSNPLSKKLVNLGFVIKSKNQFGYLVFPDEGKGYRNPVAQEFSVKGAEEASPGIEDGLLEVLERAMIEIN